MNTRCTLILGVLLLLVLAGCGAPVADDQDDVGIGGNSPEAVVESFFEDFNRALQDPKLGDGETNRAWAERLANYFAPIERVRQRTAMIRMLASFAYRQQQIAEGQRLIIEITYTNAEVVERTDDRASVRLIDGKIRFQRVAERENGDRDVLRTQERGLMETLGQTSGVLPVLRVNGRWFMTEG